MQTPESKSGLTCNAEGDVWIPAWQDGPGGRPKLRWGRSYSGRIWRLVQTVTKPLPEHVGLAGIVAVVIGSH